MSNAYTPRNADKPLWYVPWQGYTSGKDANTDHPLDVLCLQGPHPWAKAHQIAAEMRSQGMRASVIDCSRTLLQRSDSLTFSSGELALIVDCVARVLSEEEELDSPDWEETREKLKTLLARIDA